jgi:hypothetical protein
MSAQASARDLYLMPLDRRLADVCAGCGQHIVRDPADRLLFLQYGGTVQCPHCALAKTICADG